MFEQVQGRKRAATHDIERPLVEVLRAVQRRHVENRVDAMRKRSHRGHVVKIDVEMRNVRAPGELLVQGVRFAAREIVHARHPVRRIIGERAGKIISQKAGAAGNEVMSHP